VSLRRIGLRDACNRQELFEAGALIVALQCAVAKKSTASSTHNKSTKKPNASFVKRLRARVSNR